MRKKVLFVTIALLAAALLNGCAGGAVRGTTWPGLAADDKTAYLADGPYVYASQPERWQATLALSRRQRWKFAFLFHACRHAGWTGNCRQCRQEQQPYCSQPH